MSSDVTVNVGLINYAFCLKTIGRGQLSLLRQLQLLIPVSLGLSFRTLGLYKFTAIKTGKEKHPENI